MHGCLPSMQNHYELQEAVREDFSTELRRKGFSKHPPILLNDSHPLESGWWIPGYETCCGFLQLIHENVYFISFIHLIFYVYIYIHTLFLMLPASFPPYFSLQVQVVQQQKNTPGYAQRHPSQDPKIPPQVYCSFVHSNSSWRPKNV